MRKAGVPEEYAVGPIAEKRSMGFDAIVAKVREKNYGFRSLIHEIVKSELLQTK